MMNVVAQVVAVRMINWFMSVASQRVRSAMLYVSSSWCDDQVAMATCKVVSVANFMNEQIGSE